MELLKNFSWNCIRMNLVFQTSVEEFIWCVDFDPAVLSQLFAWTWLTFLCLCKWGCSNGSCFPPPCCVINPNVMLRADVTLVFWTTKIDGRYQPGYVRLQIGGDGAPNRTNLGLFKISFSTFWRGAPKCTETDLKKSPICPIWCQTDPRWCQP